MSKQKNSNFFRELGSYVTLWRVSAQFYGKFGVFMLGLFSGYYVLCGGDPESKVKGNASHEGILLVIGNV